MTTFPRGTSNSNVRGNSIDRARRRKWLLENWAADRYVVLKPPPGKKFNAAVHLRPACRCYRCGALLTEEQLTVDRIIPGCLGGKYRRNNIRPACETCNSETGAALATRKS